MELQTEDTSPGVSFITPNNNCETDRPQCSPARGCKTALWWPASSQFDCRSVSAVTQPHPACPVDPPTPGLMQFLSVEWNSHSSWSSNKQRSQSWISRPTGEVRWGEGVSDCECLDCRSAESHWCHGNLSPLLHWLQSSLFINECRSFEN